ncbi:hypothetical protein IVA93_39845 (plasmid) [Bradyrhizobium sp. 155]|uniref:hypothetical protein n=1 Tax=Bradyrhizobium sp. 155 TaxID=2782629 RepID=UPI001FFE58F2|nr:hypothetical protein [Bradyrhizobium sp. 155]UPK15959.1 hypothetical protein IVA93_39845 [Bradyrhizobium sp. 155]
MDTETFALLMVQKVTLVGLIKFLHMKGVLDQDLIVEFLQQMATPTEGESEGDALKPHLVEGFEAMIASIEAEHGWKPTIIPGGKK